MKVALDTRFKECSSCGIWKTEREDPHHYVKEYYRNETLQIFRDGIVRRQWYFNAYKKIWDSMEVDFDKLNRFLEIGCGVARLLWSFSRDYNKTCVGVESSSWANSWAKRTLGFDKKFEVYDVNFELMDKTTLGKFDFIYSCHVFEHLEDPMKAIEDCFKLLNEEGYFFLAVPDKAHQKFLHRHNWAFCKKSLKLWFQQAGFENIKVFLTPPFNGLVVNREQGFYLHIIGQKVKNDKK